METRFVRLANGTADLNTLALVDRIEYQSVFDPSVFVLRLDEPSIESLRNIGAQVYGRWSWEVPDSQQFRRPMAERAVAAEGLLHLDDLLRQVKAPDAWQSSQGENVTIAVIDSGINGVHQQEFGPQRRSPESWSSDGSNPWADDLGHGTMCATIAAAGAPFGGGRFRGVAPNSTILSARTTEEPDSVFRALEHVLSKKICHEIPGPLVVNLSREIKGCDPPTGPMPDDALAHCIRECVKAGIVVVFAAGNNHSYCGTNSRYCKPNSIWAFASLDEVLTVGQVGPEGRNDAPPYATSSRGPGEWAHERPKPDCVAPSYGTVLAGDGPVHQPTWQTSGACAVVSGLAALLLGIDPDLTPREVGAAIRGTCRRLDQGRPCVGEGLIDCAAAVGSQVDGRAVFPNLETRDAYCRKAAEVLGALRDKILTPPDAALSFVGLTLAERRQVRADLSTFGIWTEPPRTNAAPASGG